VKSPILIGSGLAVVILVASLLAPRLGTGDRRKAERVQEQVLLAQRELGRHSIALARADAVADATKMVSTPGYGAAVSAATESLAQTSAEYGTLSRTAQELARRCGLPAPTLPPFAIDAAGLQRAMTTFESAAKENHELLARAAKDAAEAVAMDAQALGAQQTVGMAAYVRAVEALAASQELRGQQASAQARWLETAAEWKLSQGLLAYYRGLEPGPIVAGLRSDLAELDALHAETVESYTRLADQVAERKAHLAQVEQELSTQQQRILELEKEGFKAGQDEGIGGFQPYRAQYLKLSETGRQLQMEQAELRYGGLRGATASDDDWASGTLRGGEPFLGLEELERRLEVAQQRVERLEQARKVLAAQIVHADEASAQAQKETAQYQERLTQLATQVGSLRSEIENLAKAAFDMESEALKAADNAVRAFGQAQRVAEAWFNALRATQRDKDPIRKNERLERILKDPYFEHVSRSAEASARVLAGRIHVARVESGESLLGDARVFTEMYTDPHFSFDPAPFEEQVETARAVGRETLQKAAETYTLIADRLSSAPTVWVPLGSAAATYHLLARIDFEQREACLSKAVELVQRAVEKRELFPYARELVAFRDHLVSAAKAPAEGKPAPEQPAKAEEPESDFFTDEK
jgi:hypothetical protein